MPLESAAGPAISVGKTLLERLQRKTRIRVEASAKAETRAENATANRPATETHCIEIKMRVFNVGSPITVTRAALIKKPSLWSRLAARYAVLANASEMTLIYGGSRSERHLPTHIPSGDWREIKFRTEEVWPPQRLKQIRLAVWHAASNRATLTSLEVPKEIAHFSGRSHNPTRTIRPIDQ